MGKVWFGNREADQIKDRKKNFRGAAFLLSAVRTLFSLTPDTDTTNTQGKDDFSQTSKALFSHLSPCQSLRGGTYHSARAPHIYDTEKTSLPSFCQLCEVCWSGVWGGLHGTEDSQASQPGIRRIK